MATDRPTRADVLRQAAALLTNLEAAPENLVRAATERGLALLQLHDRLPADPPAAMPVVEPADPWAPVMTVWGWAVWHRDPNGSRYLSCNPENATPIIASTSRDGRWYAYPGKHGDLYKARSGHENNQRAAVRAALDALRRVGSLPPLPTKGD